MFLNTWALCGDIPDFLSSPQMEICWNFSLIIGYRETGPHNNVSLLVQIIFQILWNSYFPLYVVNRFFSNQMLASMSTSRFEPDSVSFVWICIIMTEIIGKLCHYTNKMCQLCAGNEIVPYLAIPKLVSSHNVKWSYLISASEATANIPIARGSPCIVPSFDNIQIPSISMEHLNLYV